MDVETLLTRVIRKLQGDKMADETPQTGTPETAKPETVASDPSVNPQDPNATPTTTPADNPDVETQAEPTTLLQSLNESSTHLTPGEIPSPQELPKIVGALIHYLDNDKLPESQTDTDDGKEG